MKKMAIKGFRCFERTTEFELERLTLITGGNSVGKSSLLKAVSILTDTLSGDGSRLDFDGPNSLHHGVPSMQQALPWSRDRRRRNVHAHSLKRLSNHKFQFSSSDGDLTTDLTFMAFEDVEEAHLVSVTVRHVDFGVLVHAKRHVDVRMSYVDFEVSKVSLKYAKALSSLPNTISRTPYVLVKVLKGDSLDEDDLKRYSRRYRGLGERRLDKSQEEIVEQLRGDIEEFEAQMVAEAEGGKIAYRFLRSGDDRSGANWLAWLRHGMWIGDVGNGDRSHRVASSVSYALIQNAFVQFGSVFHLSSKRDVAPRVAQYGSNVYSIYRQKYLEQKKRKKKSVGEAFLLKWMKDLGIGTSYEIVPVEGVGYTALIVNRAERRNLADFAMGQAQLFRFLLVMSVAIDRNTRGITRFLVEEPDANLHPSAQSMLIDPLCEAMRLNDSLRIVIETHSEYLLRRLQLAVKNGELSAEDAVVNYVSSEVGAVSVKPVRIMANGKLDSKLGTGFLDEGASLAIDLL